MKGKAYIVANEQQERNVLEKLEQECLLWHGGEYPTEFMPSKRYAVIFPYAIFVYDTVYWNMLSKFEDEEIIFDGRKESKMSEKYVVSQEFMNELEEWKEHRVATTFVNDEDISNLSTSIDDWWLDDLPGKERNNRLIAIIRWVNGEDVFEVEQPKKWIVRSKVKNQFGDFGYVSISEFNIGHNSFYIGKATRFDTKEEAQSWANSHQEVIEVDE